MSNRETQIGSSIQQWRGVDQRTSPTLVQDGFFVFSRGVYFGLGDNAERVPGKTLSVKLSGPILQIFQFGSNTIIQSYGQIDFVDTASLINKDVAFAVDVTVGGDDVTIGGAAVTIIV